MVETDIKSNSGDFINGNEEYVNWKKWDLYYKVEQNLAELCCRILRKVPLDSNETGYLTEEISKQKVSGATSFLLTVYSDMYKKKDELKKKL